MIVGILTLEIYIAESTSLKQKRMVLHSFKARLRNSFNVAVTQVADEDKWQKSTLAVVGVERNRRSADSLLSNVVNFTNEFAGVSIINHHTELI
jgi:uncharacterized protein YlxP (DUF503 family)